MQKTATLIICLFLIASSFSSDNNQPLKVDSLKDDPVQLFTVSGFIKKGNEAVKDAWISFFLNEHSVPSAQAISDNNGFYKVNGLLKGSYRVRTSSIQNDELSDDRKIEISNDTILNIEFGSETISGKIPSEFLNCRDFPVNVIKLKRGTVDEETDYSDHWIRFDSQAKIDKNGSFFFNNLKAGQYCVFFIACEQNVISEPFEIGNDRNYEIEFIRPDANLRILVYDSENQPLTCFAITLINDLHLPFFPKQADKVKGLIEFESLPKGNYCLCIQKDGFVPIIKEDIRISPNSNDMLKINLEKSAIVKFVLAESAKKKITKQFVYSNCKMMNTFDGKPYAFLSSFGRTYEKKIYIVVPKEISDDFPDPNINVPAGRYIVRFEIFECESPEAMNTESPVFEGETEVNLTAGRVNEVVLKE